MQCMCVFCICVDVWIYVCIAVCVCLLMPAGTKTKSNSRPPSSTAHLVHRRQVSSQILPPNPRRLQIDNGAQRGRARSPFSRASSMGGRPQIWAIVSLHACPGHFFYCLLLCFVLMPEESGTWFGQRALLRLQSTDRSEDSASSKICPSCRNLPRIFAPKSCLGSANVP